MDAFALLGVERRPLPDSREIRDSHRSLAAEAHPDRVPPEKREEAASMVSDINKALAILESGRQRLAHLHELETGRASGGSVGAVPPQAADLFMKVASVCREADLFLREKRAASSLLEQAALAGREHEVMEKVEELSAFLTEREASFEEELTALDQAWIAGARDMAALEDLARRLAFHERWREQVRERLFALAVP